MNRKGCDDQQGQFDMTNGGKDSECTCTKEMSWDIQKNSLGLVILLEAWIKLPLKQIIATFESFENQ